MPESTKSPAEVLKAAADLLEKPGAWTQGAYARDSSGKSVGPDSQLAECFCALGAIRRSGNYADDVNPAAMALGRSIGFRVGDWNDALKRTQSEVVAALREAARQASIRGGEA
ncbi:DUF6197 family protein [Brevundimonas sanguinis]|uniref:DUF6197 family protein n=1 Tax=Brevundimonas sanguinis TaxID=3021811 RepID=UPI0024153E8E|nr:hypothetical protein [Brevundimonas sp. NCCP 15609]